jgi:CheY-like chemotaxis protein/HPt (histidine-containing phosphotransfer) domain-containing protein
VLLAEDNPVNQRIAQAALESLGCEVVLADDGESALAAAAAQPLDLVLMDVHMPHLDGLSATRELRRMGVTRREARDPLPVIALTAYAMQGDRERCLEAGMNDYLTKPFARDALRTMLARWLPAAVTRPEPLERTTGMQPADASDQGAGATALLDEAVLHDLRQLGAARGSELLRRAVALWLDDTPPRIQALALALRHGDSSDAASIAHAVRSGCAQLGAARLAALAGHAESKARTGLPAQGEPALAQALLATLHETETAMRALGTTLTGSDPTAPAADRPQGSAP